MIEISISDVRRALWRELPQKQRTEGETASPWLGQLFHQATAELLGGDKLNQWQAALDAGTIADSALLSDHIYERLIGPHLAARQAALRDSGAQVLLLWKAVRAFSDWLTGLLSDAHGLGRIRFNRRSLEWQGDLPLCLPEQVLTWELNDPAWRAPVRVSGIADSLWKNSATGRWCVVEYKLGRGAREIDLAQACLYHEMLAASGLAASDGALALVAFKPDREETFFQSSELASVKQSLQRLIGALAGVSGREYPPTAVHLTEATATAEKIVQIYAQYGVSIALVGEPIVGPSFIRYSVLPTGRSKVADVRKRADELQVNLNLETAPMIDVVNGRLVVDVKRDKPEPVLFRQAFSHPPSPSSIPMGVGLTGTLYFVDISQSTCPHLLIAGTSGSGKSEWMRAALAGLLIANTPQTLQLVLIDPKRAAFNGMEDSPFLFQGWGLLHPNDRSIAEVLDVLIDEMDRRNLLFKQSNADDLCAYNAKSSAPLPRIVLFCDEYFDLIAAKKTRGDIENRIARIGAKGRSSGIHLLIATQYPKADVVTSVIKANLSGRVCLRLTDSRQSMVVLDKTGAEQLLGKGDLLFQDIGEPKRLQALWLPEADRLRLFKSNEY